MRPAAGAWSGLRGAAETLVPVVEVADVVDAALVGRAEPRVALAVAPVRAGPRVVVPGARDGAVPGLRGVPAPDEDGLAAGPVLRDDGRVAGVEGVALRLGVAVRVAVGLRVVGVVAALAGGGVLGGAPAPNAKPSTVPGAGS
ncbi:hypothetical protein [Pedococcus sp. 5OH_020]|uniref:hypothetical protein n=1 Tax=Pedococcus sp. 5OH_020 TaxID=2989814 RepID=UPI0022E9D657|nr:hypothetical protein [Pedococcus sp. 5OH_020]